MFKRLIAVAALSLCAAGLMAQTVDFTGITVSTEKVKKKTVYEPRSYIVASGALFINPINKLSPVLGVRYCWVKKLGFYAAVEMSPQGFPKLGSEAGDGTYIFPGYKDGDGKPVEFTGKRKNQSLAGSFGLVMRFGKKFDMSLGPCFTLYSCLEETADGRWLLWSDGKSKRNSGVCYGGELAGYWHINHLTIMAGMALGAHEMNVGLAKSIKLGLGYKF